MNRWVLVSDASRAMLFVERMPGGTLDLVEQLEHPDSRARARDLMADASGRKPVGPSMGGHYGGRSVSLGAGRVGAAPDTDPKEVEGEKFAREISAVLEDRRLQHAFDELVLVAPPHFLGLLKGALTAQVQKLVEGTVSKDLSMLDAREIEAHLRERSP